ncbi:MAG: DnaD domain protein [Lachnospiraceae bacterium]
MSTITISTDRKFSATVVPNLFIDRYMPSANGAYVKVYLYLLRCMSGAGEPFTLSVAAEQLDETEKDILRALAYWEKVHVLSLTREKDELTGITFLDLSSEPFEERETADLPRTSNVISLEQRRKESVSEADGEEPYTKPVYTEKQISELMKKEDISWLMNIIEVYLERLLTPQDVNLVLYLYETLGFSKELILHLYEYCISKNKKKCEYIEAVAISWHKEGIDTVEKAEQVSMMYDTCFNAVNRAFSLGRLPGAKERDFLKRWSAWKFSPELIEEACNRTLLQIGKPDFKYTDKILESWHKEGIRTLKDVEEADKAFAAQSSEKHASRSQTKPVVPMTKSAGSYNSYPQRQYSEQELLEIERRLLSN